MDFCTLSQWLGRSFVGATRIFGISLKTSLYVLFWGNVVIALSALIALWYSFNAIIGFDVADYGVLDSVMYSLGVDIIYSKVVLFFFAIPAVVFVDVLICGIQGLLKLYKQSTEICMAWAAATGIWQNPIETF